MYLLIRGFSALCLFFVCALLFGDFTTICLADETPEQGVAVTNVVTERHGAFLKVTYDLATSDDEPAIVFGSFSTDEGDTFTHAMRTVSGDANRLVSPGVGRWFVWNFHADGISGLINHGRARVMGGVHPGMEVEIAGIVYCWIPAGTFIMGSSEDEADRGGNEGPQRQITLTDPFWLSKYPVTEGQWRMIMEAEPPLSAGDNYPVNNLSWDTIAGTGGFMERYNTAYPGNDFRLPTEAEWEYACRARTTSRFYWGDDLDYMDIGAYAWYEENNLEFRPQPVGQKLANAWGLHDMAGNVGEWCADWYWGSYLEDDILNPTGPTYEELTVLYGMVMDSYPRVIRGAFGFLPPQMSRSASRLFSLPESEMAATGFRVVRAAPMSKSGDPGDSPVFALDARPETLAPFVEGVPYTAVSALEDGVAEAMRDLNGDGYPDAFADINDDGYPDAFFEQDAEGRHTALLDLNDNTFPDWFETRYSTPVAKFIFTTSDIDSRSVGVRNVSVAGAPGPDTVTGYHWDFGDGTEHHGFEPPAHTYAVLDNYTITLRLSWTGGEAVTWTRPLLSGIQGTVIYVDAERGRDEDGFGGSWLTPFQSLAHAVTTASSLSDVNMVWARAGIYTETANEVLTLRRNIAVYGGFVGHETSLADRDLSMGLASVIDGENVRCCVVGADNAILDGFTIRHGQWDTMSGIFCWNTAPEIRNCIIVDNAYSGVFCDGEHGRPTLINCVIAGNEIGVRAIWDSAPEIRFCTIVDNNAGVSVSNALVDVSGCIMWNNTAGIVVDEGSAPEVYYSLVQDGFAGTGNITADPLFRDAQAGDYQLLPGSPALDSGWATAIPEMDILGRTRPWGGGPDMGAFEYQGEVNGEVEILPLDTFVERRLTHGQNHIFAVPTDGIVSGDLVAALTPLQGAGSWRLTDAAGHQGFASEAGLLTITPYTSIGNEHHQFVISYFDFSSTDNAGVFRFGVQCCQRYVASWPEQMTLSAAGPATASIRGAGFVSGMTIELRGADNTLLAAFAASHTSPNLIRVVLDAAELAPGVATIAVVWPDNDALYIANGVSIVSEGVGPVLDAWLESPPAMRPNRNYTLWLHYANKGDANMKAPLFIVSCPDVLFRLDANDNWRANSLQVLGLCEESPVTLLPPGYQRSIPIHIQITGLVGERLEFTLRQMPHNTTAVDWEAYRDLLRPKEISPTEWNVLWPSLRGYLGTTWGDYLDALYVEAEFLAALGCSASNVDALVSPAIRRALGRPVARIAGRVVNRQTGAPIIGAKVKAQSADDQIFYRTSTEKDGSFLMTNLEDGAFGLYVEGWHIEPEVVVWIVDQMDVINVTLHVQAMIAPPDTLEPSIDKRAPVAATDPSGRLWMMWSQEDHTRWAAWESGAWIAHGRALDTGAPIKSFGYAPGLFGANDGLFVVWERNPPPHLEEVKTSPAERMEIHASLAQITDDGVDWSAPCMLSGSLYENVLPTSVMRDGELLLGWLQFDPDIPGGLDDTDLYYALHDLSCFVFEKASLETIMNQDKAQHCVDVSLKQGTQLPNSIPLIGGKYSFDLRFNACGEESCEAGRQISGGISFNVEFCKLLSGGISGSGSGSWVVACEPSPEWVFNQATVTAGGNLVATVEIPIPIVAAAIPLGTAYVGYTVRAGVSGTLIWKDNFPGWPTGGYIDGSIGGSGLLRFAGLDAGGVLKDGMVGVKGEAITMVKVRWVPLTSVSFLGYCVTLVGEVSALNGLVKYTIDSSWGPACGKTLYPYLAPGSFHAIEKDNALEWIWLGDEDEPYTVSVHMETASGMGTGGVYEGLPVLENVEEDFYGDGAPVLIDNGVQTLLLWTKDSDTPATQTGSRIAWSLFDNDAWSAPAYIEDLHAINSTPAATFLPDGWALALWSQASADGLTETSPIGDVLEYAKHTQLMHAFFDGVAWTEPASIPGATQHHIMSPALASDDAGNIVAAWLSGTSLDGQQLWTAYWDGAAWSVPELLAEVAHADAPVVAATDQGFHIICAVAHYDEDVASLHWELHEAHRDDDAWSSLTPMPALLFEPFALAPDEAPGASANAVLTSYSWDKGLPEDCCEGEGEGEGEDEGEDEPPEPPEPPLEPGLGDIGGVVGSVDPNEKLSTGGLGDQETQRYISAGDRVEYVIFFENLPTATAAAQEVFVTDQLPSQLDWATFQLHEIAWGNQVVPVSQTQIDHYAASILVPDHRPDVGKTWRVDIAFTMDVVSGECLWALRTIDPDTGELPEDVWAGFLPPNNPEVGDGEGHIVFSVISKSNLPDGARIENLASIVFDENTPIITNTIFNIVANAPRARFSASHSGGAAPLTVTFNNLSAYTPGSVSTWDWDFDDGATSDEESPVHTFNNPGEYTVRLNVLTPMGEDRTSTIITVTASPVEGEEEGEGELEGESEGEVEGEGEPLPGTIRVPDVIGKTQSEATAILESLGFKVVVNTAGRKAPKGQVTAQNPAADTEIEAGATVTITVSKGRALGIFGCGPADSHAAGDWGDLLLATLLISVLLLRNFSRANRAHR